MGDNDFTTLRRYRHPGVVFQSFMVDSAVRCNDSPIAFRNLNFGRIVGSVENKLYLLPLIAVSVILD